MSIGVCGEVCADVTEAAGVDEDATDSELGSASDAKGADDEATLDCEDDDCDVEDTTGTFASRKGRI